MKKNTATLPIFRLLPVIFLTATFFTGCESSKEKTIQTDTTKMKTDSFPKLNKDPKSSTRPEVIKN